MAVSHSAASDRRAARYSWATVLLGAGGKASFSLAYGYSAETWFPEYGYALGKPKGKRTRRAGGLHLRRFARGVVVVNPTSRTRKLKLPGGATYSGSGRSSVRRITLKPRGAAILLRDEARA